MRGLTTVMVLCFISAGPAWSGSLYLAWDCDIPACTDATWLLSRAQVTIPAGLTRFEERQPMSASPAVTCQKIDPTFSAEQSYCADIGCPTDGLYTLYLEATAPNVPKDTFDHTNTITFAVQTCQLVDYEDLYATVQPDTGTPSPLPDEADVAPIPSEDEASPLPDVPTAAPAAQAPSQPSAPPTRASPIATVPPKRPPVAPQPVPVVPRPHQPSRNLITAPTPQQPWQSGSFAGTQTQTGIDRTVQRLGHPVQKLTGRGDFFAQTTSAPFPVETGQTYDVSAWVKLQGITKLVEVDVFYWDAQGNQLKAWGEAIGGRLNGTRDWTRLAGQVTVPSGASKAVVQVRVMSRGGAAWVDDVQMSGRSKPVVVAAPPREPEPTPVRPGFPEMPTAPLPLPAPIPAQTQKGLKDQFAVLEAEYQVAQQGIRDAYDATLQRLATDHSPEAQHHRKQARAAGTKALNNLYQVLLGHWKTLLAQWKVVS